MRTHEFNLLDEQWIPVLYANGESSRIGIHTALRDAGVIRQIATPNPMDRVALLRFLLALIYWCQGNPSGNTEKSTILADGRFPAEWYRKLGEGSACFNLLGDGERFYQSPGASRRRAITDLLQEIPTGNNFWHFRHSTDGHDGLCPSCCALGLLRLPLFSVSGLPDLKAGINGAPPVYVIPIGASLLHTILLNWIVRDSIGAPAWEPDAIITSNATLTPLLNGLTSLSRHVWLNPPAPPAADCTGCGIAQPALIRDCQFQSAGPLRDENWHDPHVLYSTRQAKSGQIRRESLDTPDLTKRSFQQDKPWASLFMGIRSSGPFDGDFGGASLLAVGFATDQARNIDVWERTIAISPPAAKDGIADMVRVWSEEATRVPLRMKPKGSRSRGMEFKVAATAIRPQIESGLSRSVFSGAPDNPEHLWERTLGDYRQLTAAVAASLIPGFTTRAVQRRNDIINALPAVVHKRVAKSSASKEKGTGCS